MKRGIMFFLAICLALIFGGCATYHQNMINDGSHIVDCNSWGQGCMGIATAQKILKDCIVRYEELGYLKIEEYGVIGVKFMTGGSAEVVKVAKSSPAEKEGIQVGDVFVSVNGYEVENANEVVVQSFCKAGKVNNYEIQRNGERLHFSITTIPYTNLSSE